MNHDINTFLQSIGWDKAKVTPVAGDASVRSYKRLTLNGESRILMHDPEQASLRAFVKIQGLLKSAGVSVPEIHRVDEGQGLLLEEDFGMQSFAKLWSDTSKREELLSLAIENLVYLQKIVALDQLQGLSDYCRDSEVVRYWDWYVPHYTSAQKILPEELIPETREVSREAFVRYFDQLGDTIAAGPRSIQLLDYHVGNLMLLPEREGHRQCGVLDFQDAGVGSVVYDLVSLLDDARRDIEEGLRQRMIEKFAVAGDYDLNEIKELYRAVARQRHTRTLGTLTRLAERDGKPEYLQYIPRVEGYLRKLID